MNPTLSVIATAAPAIAMLGVFACLIGGTTLIVKRRDRRKGALMLVAGIVLFANVLLWTV